MDNKIHENELIEAYQSEYKVDEYVSKSVGLQDSSLIKIYYKLNWRNLFFMW